MIGWVASRLFGAKKRLRIRKRYPEGTASWWLNVVVEMSIVSESRRKKTYRQIREHGFVSEYRI